MYDVLVVEDNREAAQTLQELLQRFSVERGVELACSWSKSAMDVAADRHPADIIFLDIGLPGFSGMEMAQLLRTYDRETPIVFVTSLAQYVAKGYEVEALDFLVKPVRYPDVAAAMDRAIRRVDRNRHDTLVVQTREGSFIVEKRDVVSVESHNHDLVFHMEDGSRLISRATLTELEDSLRGSSFVRVSKGMLVNMRHVRLVNGSELRLSDGMSVAVSRSRRKAVMEELADYLGESI